jgi:hypothetical protein
MKQRRSDCSGRQETSLRRQAKFLPGTAKGPRSASRQKPPLWGRCHANGMTEGFVIIHYSSAIATSLFIIH